MRKQIESIVDFLDKTGTAWTGKFKTEMEVADRKYGVYVGCEAFGVSMEVVFPIKIQSTDMRDVESVVTEVNNAIEFGMIDLLEWDGIPVLKLYAVKQLPDKNAVSADTLEMLQSYAKQIIEDYAQKIYDAVAFTEEDQQLTIWERFFMIIMGQNPNDIAREKRRTRLREEQSE